ncbi:MAG: ATP-binding protein [Bacteroidia bacterium]|nr:ATP-binding protein [Bacteroidia bacterium]
MQKWLFKKKVIIVYGARQVGKTTLVRSLLEKYGRDGLYLNCEQMHVREILQSGNPEHMISYFGKVRLVVLDEAQKVKNIGHSLKLLVDTHADIQLVATGSSSFDLANEITEPLTGRNIKLNLYTLSLSELAQKHTRIQLKEKIEGLLRFGMYPGIVDHSEKEKITLLDELATDYLYRDVLMFERIKNTDVLMSLLKALALQLGNEVSFRELAGLLKLSVETVQRYILLLEQSFVIFRLGSFSRNLRNELARSNKFYFYDLGIRNSIIQNYNTLSNRTDAGALWENFCVCERMKYNQQQDNKVNYYFWRTYQQNEIDLIEEKGGKLFAMEFKWNAHKKPVVPELFSQTYKDSSFAVISSANCFQYLL